MVHTGSCQCGDVRLEIDGDPVFAGHCACTDCQRTSGAGHATVVVFMEPQLKISGKATKYSYIGDSGGDATREFCARCGSRLLARSTAAPGLVAVVAGVLDDQSIVKPEAVLYMRSKAHWDLIDPSLPAFETVPPAP